jgi:hypothetical protein
VLPLGSFDARRPNTAGKNLNVCRMESKQHLWPSARSSTAVAAVFLAGAGVWDAVRLARVHVPPTVSYVLAVAAAAVAFTGVLLRVLTCRPARGRNVLELAVAALALLAWWLRGDPRIPADPPLVAAELFASVVLGGSAWLDRGRARPEQPAPPARR